MNATERRVRQITCEARTPIEIICYMAFIRKARGEKNAGNRRQDKYSQNPWRLFFFCPLFAVVLIWTNSLTWEIVRGKCRTWRGKRQWEQSSFHGDNGMKDRVEEEWRPSDDWMTEVLHKINKIPKHGEFWLPEFFLSIVMSSCDFDDWLVMSIF